MAPILQPAFHVQPLARAARSGFPARPCSVDTLPNELSSFIGRREEIAAVAAHVRTSRLVTLTGPGGVGKTRLALHLARSVRTDYACSSWTALSSTVEGAHVADVVAVALGGGTQVSQVSIDELVACIGNSRLLLVLDNCEQVIDACAELVTRVLQHCAGVHIIATSREALGVSGELVYPVAPLPVPGVEEPLEHRLQNESVQLFVERARARVPQFELTSQSADSAAHICRTLNGIPLAIELAAARTSTMSVTDIAQRLDDPLGLLVVGTRAAPPRQQSLRASVDWSHALLPTSEQQLLRRLAVFDAEFLLDDAEAVCAFDATELRATALLLDRIAAQSLIQVTEKDSRARFSLLASVRQYARERLQLAGEVELLESRLRDWLNHGTAPAPPAAEPAVQAVPAPAETGKALNRRREILSERERGVVTLIASGCSNRDIADELVISRKTAEAHVSHILTKLGLFSRVQIATWGLQHGLARSDAGSDQVLSLAS